MQKLFGKLLFILFAAFTVNAFADTTTTNYGWVKPSSGSAGWDAKLNTNFDDIDTDLAAVDASVKYVLIGGNSVSGEPIATGAVTSYSAFLGGVAGQVSSTDLVKTVCPVSGTIGGFWFRPYDNTLSANVTINLFKNGASTGITLTVTAGTVASNSDLTHTVAVSAGDTLTLQAVSASGTGNINRASWGLSVTP